MTQTALARPAWPAMSLAEAHAMLTAPGQMFEMETIAPNGHPVRAWKNGPKSLVDLWMAAALYPARTFIVFEQDRVTFDAFRRAALAVARDLVARGVAKGDRVVLAMRNQTEWPIAFYGAALAGAIVTPLNAWWTAKELVYAIKDCGAVAAIFDDERFKRLRPVLSDCPDLRIRYVSRWDGPLAADVMTLDSVIGAPDTWAQLPAADAAPVEVSPEDEATLFYTSGTSGVPKGAVATHRAVTTPVLATLMSQIRAYLRRGEAPPDTGPEAPQKRYLVTIPLFHVTGCFAALNVSIAIGAMLIVMRKWEPETAMRLIERERATAIGGVPTIAWQLLEHPARGRYDLSSVDSITYGGAPAASELVRRLRADLPGAYAGCGWGMTETCATFTHHFAEDYEMRPDSCGPATPVADMKIVDREGYELPIGEIGELWVRGPHVVAAYWNRPQANAETFVDGWLKTGDLARLDDEGFCYIVDRAKDVIIRGGENIYSAEVEDVLYRHPAVMDAALVPIPHQSLGEEAGAIVTLKPGRQVSADELKAFVGEHLASFKVPAYVVMRHEPLPRNANGKILKSELRAGLVETLKDRVA